MRKRWLTHCGWPAQHIHAPRLVAALVRCLPVQAQQRQVDAENEARRAAWRAACDDIVQRRTAAAEAKTAAERDLATARTQQAAERAQAAIAAAVVAAEAQAQQVGGAFWQTGKACLCGGALSVRIMPSKLLCFHRLHSQYSRALLSTRILTETTYTACYLARPCCAGAAAPGGGGAGP